MTCSRCTHIPHMEFEDCKVYIGFHLEHLQPKIERVLQQYSYSYENSHDHYVVAAPHFRTLIQQFSTEDSFNALERKEISIFPTCKEHVFSFGLFFKVKSLHYWIQVLHSSDLLYVLENNTLTTHFQPIWDVSKGEVYGYELLARGIGADGALVSPFRLFSTAKEVDLLFNLDRQCRETSIRNASLQGIDKKIFINFIPTAIYDPNQCLRTTNHAVQSSNLSPHQITFEVTETELVNDYGHLKKILDFYKNQGYSVALDDVGSGYTSINTFMALAPDIIKLDMKLIRDIHTNSTNQFILESLIHLSKPNQVTLLAEGVETAQEFQYLKDKGISLMQGYYIGKPSSKPEVPQLHLY